MFTSQPVASLSDAALLDELAACAEARRAADARAAEVAGEIKARSSFEAGYSGLAQSQGARTPELLVQQITGLSKPESAAVVRVGSRPEFLDAVKPSEIGVAKVDAVRRGLGEVTPGVGASELRAAAAELAAEAGRLSVEEVAARARAARDALDARSIADRERLHREARFLTITPRLDGAYDIRGRLEAEQAMILKSAIDSIVAPRRGGPRFVDKTKAAEQERNALEDQRTVPQMMVDALVDLVAVAVATADGAELTGAKGQVTLHALRQDDGSVSSAHFEGQPDEVSAETLERYLCNSDSSVVGFEHGEPIDSSSDQRLFNRRQRRALAARWGGCGFPRCDRPPSWTEAHHLKPWANGHHKTETADGILLCRHHHMLIHNNGWQIVRIGVDYVLHAPDGTMTRLESKSPLYRRHRGGAARPASAQPTLLVSA